MIFPFLTRQHDINFLSTISRTNKKGNNVNTWIRYRITPQEIRKELREMNNIKSNNCIFSSYRLDKNYYSLYGIDYTKLELLPHNQLDPIEFEIDDICIHMFETGISFLELRYSIKNDKESSLLNLNYYLLELKADIELNFIRFVWNEELKKKEKTCSVMKVVDYIKAILCDFEHAYDLDLNLEIKSYSTKPTLFSYIFLDNPEEKMKQNLGMNMKASYKINNDSILKTMCFDNSTWYYSLNSAVNISTLVNDEITTNFFKTTFVDKISNLYFFLFLQSIHQRCFLQLCHYETRSYNFDLKTFDENKKLTDQLAGYSASFNKCWLKYFFDRPASIDHVNLFFVTLQNAFDITKQLAIVSADLEILTDYANKSYKLYSEYSLLASDKKKYRFDLITFLVASIISFVSVYDTFIKMIKNFGIELTITWHIILAVSFMIVCFIVPTVINFRFHIKKIKKTSKEMKYLEQQICNSRKMDLF